MFESLQKLAALPLETKVYCGHEYTQANARFALTVDPTNSALKERAAEIDRLRADGKATLPTTIGLELSTNPFLRWHDPVIRKNLGMEKASRRRGVCRNPQAQGCLLSTSHRAAIFRMKPSVTRVARRSRAPRRPAQRPRCGETADTRNLSVASRPSDAINITRAAARSKALSVVSAAMPMTTAATCRSRIGSRIAGFTRRHTAPIMTSATTAMTAATAARQISASMMSLPAPVVKNRPT